MKNTTIRFVACSLLRSLTSLSPDAKRLVQRLLARWLFDRPKRPQIWIQTSPRGDSRWCASGFGHRGSSLQWYIVPRAACHICEPKRSVSWYLAQEDYYGRSGAQLQLYCDVAGEALGPAI